MMIWNGLGESARASLAQVLSTITKKPEASAKATAKFDKLWSFSSLLCSRTGLQVTWHKRNPVDVTGIEVTGIG